MVSLSSLKRWTSCKKPSKILPWKRETSASLYKGPPQYEFKPRQIAITQSTSWSWAVLKNLVIRSLEVGRGKSLELFPLPVVWLWSVTSRNLEQIKPPRCPKATPSGDSFWLGTANACSFETSPLGMTLRVTASDGKHLLVGPMARSEDPGPAWSECPSCSQNKMFLLASSPWYRGKNSRMETASVPSGTRELLPAFREVNPASPPETSVDMRASSPHPLYLFSPLASLSISSRDTTLASSLNLLSSSDNIGDATPGSGTSFPDLYSNTLVGISFTFSVPPASFLRFFLCFFLFLFLCSPSLCKVGDLLADLPCLSPDSPGSAL